MEHNRGDLNVAHSQNEVCSCPALRCKLDNFETTEIAFGRKDETIHKTCVTKGHHHIQLPYTNPSHFLPANDEKDNKVPGSTTPAQTSGTENSQTAQTTGGAAGTGAAAGVVEGNDLAAADVAVSRTERGGDLGEM